jgi:hypothetical protein
MGSPMMITLSEAAIRVGCSIDTLMKRLKFLEIPITNGRIYQGHLRRLSGSA